MGHFGCAEQCRSKRSHLIPQSRQSHLPPRIDRVQTSYLDLVQDDAGTAIDSGRLFCHCHGRRHRPRTGQSGCIGHVLQHPDARQGCFRPITFQPPAPLEDVIDASVKTGADLSAVIGWNYDHSRELLEAVYPFPLCCTTASASTATCRRKNSRRARVLRKTTGWIGSKPVSAAISKKSALSVMK